MSDLPPRSRKLVAATPLHRMRTGTKACIELTVYPDGHTAIAVSRIEGTPQSRTIKQADFLQLNHVPELRDHVAAIISHLEASTTKADARTTT
jgi:hypothetical protein